MTTLLFICAGFPGSPVNPMLARNIWKAPLTSDVSSGSPGRSERSLAANSCCTLFPDTSALPYCVKPAAFPLLAAACPERPFDARDDLAVRSTAKRYLVSASKTSSSSKPFIFWMITAIAMTSCFSSDERIET